MKITKPYTFTAGSTIVASEHNSNFDILYNSFNGDISDINVISTAGITDNKLAVVSTVGKVNLTALGVTGINTTNTGSLIWASSATSFALLATGSTTQVLKMGVDSYTKLLLPCDGLNTGTTFTDTATGKTVTNDESYDNYTELMLHLENNVTDSSSNTFAVVNSDVTYSNTVYKMGSYSAVFNGTTSRLYIADNTAWDFGAGDFTVDLWARFDTVGTNVMISNFVIDNEGWQLYTTGGNLRFQYSTDGSTDISVDRSWTPDVDTWYHIAVTRSTTSLRIFVNGIQLGAIYNIGTDTIYNSTAFLMVGSISDVALFDGYLDEIRISKGIARWTSDFTAPPAPYGQVATSTAVKKFGTASGWLDGSGSFLQFANSADFNYGTGDFTVDFQVRFNDLTTEQVFLSKTPTETDQYVLGKTTSALGNKLYMKFLFDDGSPATVGDYIMTDAWSGVAKDTWYHIAFARANTAGMIFISGTSQALTANTAFGTNDISPDGNHTTSIGEYEADGAHTKMLSGYIDEFRVSKGVARWTSNFTAPTSAYGGTVGWYAP